MAEWRRHYKAKWSDKKFMRLSFGARLMFDGLIDHADDDGFYDADPVVLKADIFPSDAIPVTEVAQYRDEIVSNRLAVIHIVDDDCFIQLPKFQKYQKTRQDTYRPSEIKARIELYKAEQPDRYESVTGPLQVRAGSVTYTDRQTDKTEQTEIKQSAPKAAPDPQISNPSKPQSVAKQVNDADVDDIRDDWSKRFPNGPELEHSLAQKVLNLCRTEWRDPRWLVGRVKAGAKDPIAYLCRVISSKPFPSPPDGESSAWTWDRWQKRQRPVPVGNSVGSVLKSIVENA